MQAQVSAAFTNELQPTTPAGRELVSIAEDLAPQFAAAAAGHDRDGTFPFENIEALKQRGYFSAPVPRELGGLGVESAHDLLIASSRLARVEPSTVIGVNMHSATVYPTVKLWRRLVAAGMPQAEEVAGLLQMVASGQVVIATPISERNQDLLMPQVRAERTADGWSITGSKIFGTMSPAATMLLSTVSFEENGGRAAAHILIPRDAPGITLHDDWDALGMRASGSVSVSYERTPVPAAFMLDAFEYGRISTDYLEGYLLAGILHATAPLGIAEAAHQCAIDGLGDRPGSPRGVTPADRATAKLLAGENAIDLMAARAALERAAHICDDYWDRNGAAPGSLEDAEATFAESQAAKTFVGRAAQRIVDRALTLSGGAGFMSKHPLSRHYRDVRAVGFMHPLAENSGPEYIGNVTLGLHPTYF